MVDEDTGRTLFPAYAIKRFGGVKVGFIGMTLEGTPNIVSPAGVEGLRFEDEAETANKYAEVLRRRHGVRAIVVLLHQGGFQTPPFSIDGCNGIGGEIVDIVERTTTRVDLFVTGHTHSAYNCVIDGRRVTSASSFGRVITKIDLRLSRRTRDVVAPPAAANRIVTQTVPKATDLTSLIARYDQIAAPLRDEVIGNITADITRTADDSGESAAGNLIADAQLAATASPDTGAAVAAFMNPGGVRADFTFAPSGAEAPGAVTFGESFTVQPFGNSLVTMTLTGAQLLELLKQQWCGQTGGRRILQPSASVAYTFDASAATEITGARVRERPEPGVRADHRRRRGRPGGELPDHRELVPGRRRGCVHGPARGHRPARRRGGHRRAGGLTCAVADRRADRAAGARPDHGRPVTRTAGRPEFALRPPGGHNRPIP